MVQPQKTEKKLRAFLGAIHPRFEDAQDMGKVVFKPLAKILQAPDDPLAPKAAYLAALMGGNQSFKLMQMAAKHSDHRVRITIAFTLRFLPSNKAIDLLMGLLADSDSHVVYRAIQSAQMLSLSVVQSAIATIAKYHPISYVRSAANRAIIPK